MARINCDHCGRFLFETEQEPENRGVIASEAKSKGYVVKLPLLYGISESFKIFCCSDCHKTWFESNVTPEQKERGDKFFKDLKKEMTSPEFIEGVQDKMGKLQDVLKGLRKQINPIKK